MLECSYWCDLQDSVSGIIYHTNGLCRLVECEIVGAQVAAEHIYMGLNTSALIPVQIQISAVQKTPNKQSTFSSKLISAITFELMYFIQVDVRPFQSYSAKLLMN